MVAYTTSAAFDTGNVESLLSFTIARHGPERTPEGNEREVPLATTKRKRFTPAQRAKILAAAKSGNLTAKQVKAKFGVSMVTYYLWRRQAGLTSSGARGAVGAGRAGTGAGTAGLEKIVRSAVRERIQDALPSIVRDEVQSYLNNVLSRAPGRRGGRRQA